jgi:tRNA dimethylallyltransferase
MKNSTFNLITILGPTATGKTNLAAHLAHRIDGEIISADSRQVYRKMNLGTGKDYADYLINGKTIPYHLIDIVDPGIKYNVFQFQRDFVNVFADIQLRIKVPILCGGSGLYIESVIKNYEMLEVPPNEKLRNELETKSHEELTNMLQQLRKLHNVSDISSKKRTIRAIEIEIYQQENHPVSINFPEIKTIIIGINYDVDSRRKKITLRLKQRLESGMIDEVKELIHSGVPADTLIYYGLEYKFLTQYILNQINYEEMVEKLNIAIHQFAKRQMTWFRKMERDGFKIWWIDGYAPIEEKVERVLFLIS